MVPEVGIICGSGLGGLAKTLDNPTVIDYKDIPNFPRTTVHGHAGQLVFGTIGDKKVVCMKGRFHFYEGNSPVTVGLPVRVMAALGIQVLVVTNAAGGINPKFQICDVMLIKDHVSMMGLSGCHPLVGANDERFGSRFPSQGGVYDPRLQAGLRETAAEIGFQHTLQIGTYMGVSGPTYESPAEIHALRMMNGDAVGMSTVFEVALAAHCGLPVLGMSLITNRCLGPDDNWAQPSHQEVLDSVNATGDHIQKLVKAFVGKLDLAPYPKTKAYTDHFKNI